MRLWVLIITLLLAVPAGAFWGSLGKIGKLGTLADDAARTGKTVGHADDAVPKAHNSKAKDESAPEEGPDLLGIVKDAGDVGQLGDLGNEADQEQRKPKARSAKPAAPASWGERLGWVLGVVLGLVLFLLLPFWLLWRGWRWLFGRRHT